MAKKINVEMVDDLDPTHRADETVEFSIDGASYEIDLSTGNATKLRKALQPWVDAARRPQRAPRRLNRGTGATRSREQTAAIRAWANANGFTVGSKGRIPVEVEQAYNNNTPATQDSAVDVAAAKKARVAKALATAEAKAKQSE